MTVEFIENAEMVTAIFGKWPSFHDAEVVSILLNREGADGPFLEATIHVSQMTSDIDEKGHFRSIHHTLVTLRFTHILLVGLKWFNGQNVLSNLYIEPLTNGDSEERGAFNILFGSSYGVEAEFNCDRIVVVDAAPYAPGD